MAYNLTNLPGNFLTDGSAYEAFTLNQSTGSFTGLFVPGRTLAVAGASTNPIVRVRGKVNGGVYLPPSSTQYLTAPHDVTWNALAAYEQWLAVGFWYRWGADAAGSGIAGVYASTATLRQYQFDAYEARIEIVDSTGSTTADISRANGGTDTNWHFICGQFYYDGSGTGILMSLYYDGSEYTALTNGSAAMTPGFPSATAFEFGRVGGTVAEDITLSSLFFWKSDKAKLNTTSLDAVYNNGSGISFLPGGAYRGLGRKRA